MSKIKRDRSSIKVSLPKKKVEKYLKFFNLSSIKKAKENQLKDLFIKIIDDFLTGYLSLDEFSSISNYLWWKGVVMSGKGKVNKEFYNLLQMAGELSFYIRGKTKKVRKTALRILDLVFDYYSKSKQQ
jgi:hypothetical protein